MTTTDNTAVIRQLEREVDLLRDKLDAETKARKDAQIIGQDLARQFDRYGLVISAALQGKRHPSEPDNDGRMNAVRAMVEENKGLRCHVERLRADRIATALEHVGRGGAEYSQGVAGDGAAILKDGHAMTIEEILSELRHPPAPVMPEGFLAHLNSVISGVLSSCEPKRGEENQYIGWQAMEEMSRLESELAFWINAAPEPSNE